MSFSVGSTSFGYFDSDPDFQVDADRILNWTLSKLGNDTITVHMSSSAIYKSFEEACLEYSATAKSVLSSFLGTPTGSLSGSENRYPAQTLELQRRLAEAYAEEAYLNGNHPVHSASITLRTGVQKYDLQALLSGSYLTGSATNARIRVKEVFHRSPIGAYRFFNTTSAVNYLHGQFGFESFTPETIFYLLPIWEDVLRGQQFKLSNTVRRSNYSYALHNNVLEIYPVPTEDRELHLTFQLPPGNGGPANDQDAAWSGVANLSNVPFGVIQYSKVNSIGKHWIRRMAFALSKEVEGHIRKKMSSIPTLNGDLNLDGPELVSDARAEQDALRQELKDILEELTYDKLAAREAEKADALVRTLQRVPLPIFVGLRWPVIFLTAYLTLHG
jgi:hypothetical protein